MIITIAFDVKNHVEVMESWPIKIDNLTFFLERKDDVVQKACISFSNVDIENAPKIVQPATTENIPSLNIRGKNFVKVALKRILNW
ncbi:hypothetical protein YA0058_13535, partial [Pseudomonas syringae]